MIIHVRGLLKNYQRLGCYVVRSINAVSSDIFLKHAYILIGHNHKLIILTMDRCNFWLTTWFDCECVLGPTLHYRSLVLVRRAACTADYDWLTSSRPRQRPSSAEWHSAVREYRVLAPQTRSAILTGVFDRCH